MNLILTVFGGIAAFAAIGMIAYVAMQVVIMVQTTPSHLEILLFGILPLWRIPLCDIRARKVTYWAPLASRDGHKYVWIVNRLSFRGYVLIHRERGIFRYIVLSPADPEKFIEKLLAGGAQRDSG